MNQYLYPTLFFLGSLILLIGLWLLWKKRGKKDVIIGPSEMGATEAGLKLFYGWVPAILGIHVAIALIVYGVGGHLFSSNQTIDKNWVYWVCLGEIMIALSLFYGGFTRPSAVIMVFLWFLGIDLIGLKAALENIQYLGFAGFFYLAGRGPYAIDRILFPSLEPTAGYAKYALLFLRVGVGINLVVLGFTQNLLGVNPQDILGLFIGSAKVLGGTLIALGIFQRTAIIVTLIAINATLPLSSWNELVTYLPTYGALAILLVWEPYNYHQRLLWVQGLRKNMSI